MVPEKTNTLPVLLFFCIVSVGLHLPSFGLEHKAGDEIVYRALSAEMAWDLSHYTTMDHPRLSKNNKEARRDALGLLRMPSRIPWPRGRIRLQKPLVADADPDLRSKIKKLLFRKAIS